MKKIIFIIALTILPFTNYAQISIFDKFEDMDDVTSVIVNKEAFKMLSKFKGSSPEAKEYAAMVENLESLKVFTTESTTIANQMNEVVTKYLKTSKLVELMRIKDKAANVKIYIRPGKDDNHVSELLMFVNDMTNSANKQAVVLSLTGEIDLNKISEITEAHIPNSGKQLKNK
ncbi:MAG: DUF4252 domain-containing protein [Bacteroidetes bacterium HGW-Bacteroidetes-3]|jgi:hypothetical protein|nr:MAG: DUF4252 domain-containing protein [Bacteroidetes bacterium HGW-Bacteroidetes-3]